MADSKVRANMLNLSGDYPFTGSVTGQVGDGEITEAKLSGTISASKLTGAMPALDGSTLTGIPGITKSASDPVVTTNPSGGVGSLWANSTSGEMFVCTDATAGANIWTNVGGGSGDIQTYSFQGTTYGYALGGYNPNSAAIDKISFTADVNVSETGSLTVARWAAAGFTDDSYAYSCGGFKPAKNDNIERVAFSNMTSSVMTTSLLAGSGWQNAGSWSQASHGYIAGGNNSSGVSVNIIQKVLYGSSDVTVTDVADMSTGRERADSCTQDTHGWSAGGSTNAGATRTDKIDKFSFATQATSTEIGQLTNAASEGGGGINSTTHGYHTQGYNGPGTRVKTIQKWSFASGTDCSIIGNMSGSSAGRVFAAGFSSTTNGYNAGGEQASNSPENVIDKVSFASDGDATDIANLSHNAIAICRGGTHN